jgi:hypothetical protein
MPPPLLPVYRTPQVRLSLLQVSLKLDPLSIEDKMLTTVVLEDDSPVNLSPRGNFDAVVSKWKLNNPDLAPQITDDALDTVWQHLLGNGTATPLSIKRAQDSDSSALIQRKTLYKRQNVTSSTLVAARAVVSDAMLQQGQINNQTLSNPRRNVYTKKPSGSANRRDYSSLSSLLTAQNSTLANALPIVAEADAAVLAQQGKLYKDYATLNGKFAKYNLPGTPSGSQHNKRADSSWWLPTIAAEAPGSLPFGGNKSAIWRNVLDYGAYGDGVHDDTAAINSALNDGCGEGCGSSTTRGAVVYLPPGTPTILHPAARN